YQPWVLLITDGEPTDEYQNAAQKVRKAAGDRKLSFYAIAVKDANITKLREIAPLDTPPLPLDGLKFKELFKWLSDSVKQTSRQKIGEQIELADFSGWKKKQA
ncbi:VWA domain-containing protein, partial [Moorena sp. SIO3H5]|uniref:vWA domain-containing protein n=1 Tax=Moorena sp. SIO3H5 TaxID=2607834 RepID=UPI0013BBBB41